MIKYAFERRRVFIAKHFSVEFKQKVIDDYNTCTYGGRDKLIKTLINLNEVFYV